MNRIIVVAVVLLVVTLSGCVQADISNINDLTASINSHMKNGDEYYNSSAANTNYNYFSKALSDSNSASGEYSMAQTSAQTALTSAQNANDDVLIDYVQNAILEIQAKLNATSELNQAIELLQKNDTEGANTHLFEANEYMNSALQYRSNRDEIVKKNPSKFKQ